MIELNPEGINENKKNFRIRQTDAKTLYAQQNVPISLPYLYSNEQIQLFSQFQCRR